MIVVWLLGAALSLLALPQVGSILRAGGFSADGIESEEAFDRYEQDFGAVGSPIQIAFHHDEWLVTDEAFAAEAARVLAPLAAMPDVMRVSTFQDNPTQIAPDGHTAYTTLFFDLHPDVAHRIVPELRGAAGAVGTRRAHCRVARLLLGHPDPQRSRPAAGRKPWGCRSR